MNKLSAVLKQLGQERERSRQEISRLDQAINAIQQLAGGAVGNGRSRTISAAARRRIAAAQRARWAKARAQTGTSKRTATIPKRRMSAGARRRIAAAQRARWAKWKAQRKKAA